MDLTKRVDNLLDELAVLSRFKFLVHKHKGDWTYKNFDMLIEQLENEVKELTTEIKNPKAKREAILSELGDVVNYCVMILDKLDSKVG